MTTHPNVVLIISDQWSTRIADGGGTYTSGVRLPGIDRLAAEGVRFTQSYATFPLCGPARASIFTGLMPHNHRIIDNEEIYKDVGKALPTRTDVPTLGTVLKGAGYKTAYFGKEHAGDYGWRAIDEFGSMKFSAGGMLAEGSAFDQIFTRDALHYLRKPQEQPFYMVLSLINPHDICKVLGGKVQGATFADAIHFCRTADEPYLRSQPRPDLPANHAVPPIKGMLRDRDYMYEELAAFTVDDWQRYIATYCLLLEKTDWFIELVLEALDATGLADDTIVVFITDHGDMMGSHGLISKTVFYEESAKVMTLVRQPGVPPAVNDEALIGTVDLMPTVLDLCGVPVPEGLDGRSFRAHCVGEGGGGFEELFALNPDGRMLRFGSYKYIRSEIYGQPAEILFDLAADPDEGTNVIGQTGYADAAAHARRRMDAILEEASLGVRFEPV